MITMGDKIKILLSRRNMTITDLAEKMQTSRQNLTNKLTRDNFSEKEIRSISEILNAEFIGEFRLRDTGEKI